MARYKGSLTQKFMGGDNVIPVSRFYMMLLGGDIWATLLLQQLLYWQDGRTRHPDNYVVKTYEDWNSEIFISERNLDRARKILAPLGLETVVKKSPFHDSDRVIHWRMDLDKVEVILRAFIDEIDSIGEEEDTWKYVQSFHGSTERTVYYIQRLYTETIKKHYRSFQNDGEDNQDMKQIQQQLPSSSGSTPPKEDMPKTVKENTELEKFLMAEIGVTTSPQGAANLLSRERVLINGDTYPSLEYYWNHPQYHDLLKEFIVMRAKQYLGLKVGRRSTLSFSTRLLTNYDSPQGWLKFAGSKGMPLATVEAMAEKEKPALETVFMMCYNGQQLEYRQIENEYPEFFSFYNGYEGDWDLFCAKWSKQNA